MRLLSVSQRGTSCLLLKFSSPLFSPNRNLTDIHYYKCVEWSHLHSWESQSARRKFFLKLQQHEQEKSAKAQGLHTTRKLEHPSTLQPVTLPKYIERGPSEILRVLCSAVKRDPTAADYKYHDDTYLIPYNSSNKRAYILSKEGGREAARYVLNNHSKLFENNLVECEPPIKKFMPKIKITEQSATPELLESYISGYNVQSAVEVYEILNRKKVSINNDLKQSLLELLAFHNEADEMKDNYQETAGVLDNNILPWLDGNMADQVYQDIVGNPDLTPDEKAQADLAILRGIAKHRRTTQGWTYYEMTKGLKSIDRFNAGIMCAPISKENFFDDWEPVKTILSEMALSGVRPDGTTLKNVMAHLKNIGSEDANHSDCCKLALSTMAEFKTLGIDPSLGTFSELLEIFTRKAKKSLMVYQIIDEVEKLAAKNSGSLLPTVIHPEDFKFFRLIMEKILKQGNLLQGYRLHSIISNHDDNQLLLGGFQDQSSYYRSFVYLILRKEPIDVSMEYISVLVPNIWTPSIGFYFELVRHISQQNGFQYLPKVWNDLQICDFCSAKQEARFEILSLIASVLTQIDLEDLSGPENLKELLNMICKEGFDLFSSPLAEKKYSLNQNVYAVPILCDLLKYSSRAGNSSLSKAIVKFCKDQTTRLIGTIDSDALQEFFNASVSEKDQSAAYDCTVYSVEQRSPNALAMALELAKNFKLEEFQCSQLNLLFSHEVQWSKL